jgi:hypothetical protein
LHRAVGFPDLLVEGVGEAAAPGAVVRLPDELDVSGAFGTGVPVDF